MCRWFENFLFRACQVAQTFWQKICFAADWLLEAIFPPKCIFCRKEGSLVCQTHSTKNFPPAPKNQVRFESLKQVFAATAYLHHNVKIFVQFFKFRGFKGLSDFAAAEMVARAPADFFAHAVLVPVPLHWTRRLWRGFNQAQLLADSIVKIIPTSRVCNDLKRHKKTRQQAQLSKLQRQQNTQNAFFWEPKMQIPKNAKIILIDDVVASGATLDCAAKTILDSRGSCQILAAVFARGGADEIHLQKFPKIYH